MNFCTLAKLQAVGGVQMLPQSICQNGFLLRFLKPPPIVRYENSTGYDAAKFTGGDKRIYTGDEQVW